MRALWRWIALACIAFVALQLFFIGRIALMAVVDPQSTSFQRSEAWRIAHERGRMHWSQQWVPYARYYVEGGSLLLTFENGSKQLWRRR